MSHESELDRLLAEIFPTATTSEEATVTDTATRSTLTFRDQTTFPHHALDCRSTNGNLMDALYGFAKAKRDDDTADALEHAEHLVNLVLAHTSLVVKDEIEAILEGKRRYSVTVTAEFEMTSDLSEYDLRDGAFTLTGPDGEEFDIYVDVEETQF